MEPQMIDECYSCGERDVLTNSEGECPHCYAEIADMEADPEREAN